VEDAVNIEIWSDVVCPWCYIGKRRFEEALSLFAHRDDVHVTWRSYQLDPDAPAVDSRSLDEMLSEKYGVPLEQAAAMNMRVTATAAQVGLEFDLGRARPGNTFDAHRLLHLANKLGRQRDAKERLMHAYFTEGRAVGDHDTLVELLAEIGIEPAESRAVLESDQYADDVRIEQDTARSLGVSGVPFFVVDRKYAVGGAQSSDVFVDVLQQAWDEAHPPTVVDDTDTFETDDISPN
jgi:predicted DsbA family dithiol-disulfide isomerase